MVSPDSHARFICALLLGHANVPHVAGDSPEHGGHPEEDVGYHATDEYTSRLSSPRTSRPASVVGKERIMSPLKKISFNPEISVSDPSLAEGETVHVPEQRRRSYVVGSDDGASADDGETTYSAPILAPDEVEKRSSGLGLAPAVEVGPERRGSAYEMEPSSRPTSRPSSIYGGAPSIEVQSTPLDDVDEYEPLFNEDDDKVATKKSPAAPKGDEERPSGFPSKDLWEDAPNSVHATAEVSTPDVTEEPARLAKRADTAPRTETPAQAFARRQEELAETHPRNAESTFQSPSPPSQEAKKPTWFEHQPQLKEGAVERPNQLKQRFPSRDVWEDSPESHQLEAEVSAPQSEEEEAEEAAAKQEKAEKGKPIVPERPSRKSSTEKPAIPERPKPQVPARPTRTKVDESTLSEAGAPKFKPSVPTKVGSKIAAMQAGFMSDLNQRLKLGPQAPKKEEPAAEDVSAPKEPAAPLSDARKGRARGPQRRAPRASPSPAAVSSQVDGAGEDAPAAPAAKLSFAVPSMAWSLDPDAGTLSVGGEPEEKAEVDEDEDDGREAAPEPKEVATSTSGEATAKAEASEDEDEEKPGLAKGE